MGINDFRLRVVGERFDNEDGTSRQEEIGRLNVGDPIQLEREPSNPFDPSAVAVISPHGIRIGYLGAARCGWVGSKIERGLDVRACVAKIVGGGRTGLPMSVIIAANLKGEDPG